MYSEKYTSHQYKHTYSEAFVYTFKYNIKKWNNIYGFYWMKILKHS